MHVSVLLLVMHELVRGSGFSNIAYKSSSITFGAELYAEGGAGRSRPYRTCLHLPCRSSRSSISMLVTIFPLDLVGHT